MFKNILVPTDFTPKNKHALEVALNLANFTQSKVTLLHVIKTIPNTEFEEFEEFYERLEQQAKKEMAALYELYSDNKTNIELKIIYGKRVEEIVQFANREQIDLIVMTSHKVDLADPIQGWGTISYKVGVLAQCPIMLVK